MTRLAFFDVDETIIRIKSMFSFHEYFCMTSGILPSVFGRMRYESFIRTVNSNLNAGRTREFINALYYRGFKGRDCEQTLKLIDQWYGALIKAEEPLYIPSVLSIIRKHQEEGTKVVLVSGSFMELLEPIAKELQVYRVLATRLETKNGRYTGKIVPPQMIGAGKALAVRTLLAAERASSVDAWGYGDHTSDFAMLEEVGHPTIVSRDPHMIDHANERGWGLVDPQFHQQEMYHA